MSIAIEQLRPRIAGFNVIDCEVKSREVLYLLAREDYTQHPGWHDMKDAPSEGHLAKRVLGIRLQGPDDRKWGHAHLTGLDTSRCAMAFAPEEKLVVVDSLSKAWSQTSGTNGFEARIPAQYEGGILRGGIKRLKSFGSELIAGNTARQIFKRKGAGQWELIGPPMPDTENNDISFDDFDQFNPDDMYAVGNPGDVWHFNGTDWRRCSFPSNWGLSAVCCAPDGNVYIAASTVIYRGLGNKWQRLRTKDQITLPIKDLAWYEGQLWATNDYGFWALQGDHLVPADVPSGVKVCSGNLAVRDGVMLLAGYGGAAFKRDGQWTEIFHDHEVRQWFENNRDKVWTPPAKP